MNNCETDKDIFFQNIKQAAVSLQGKNCDIAYSLIVEAMRINPDAPQPHNLMGIFYELTGNGNMARRHYRAAYSLDPTYKPACSNLERICTDFDNRPRAYDYGDVPEEPYADTSKTRLKNSRA